MEEIKIIDLSMYGLEFRKGFDAASVSMAVRESMSISNSDLPKKDYGIFVKIHKDSVPLCQGICSENLIGSKVINVLPVKVDFVLEDDEVWLKVFPKILKK